MFIKVSWKNIKNDIMSKKEKIKFLKKRKTLYTNKLFKKDRRDGNIVNSEL